MPFSRNGARQSSSPAEGLANSADEDGAEDEPPPAHESLNEGCNGGEGKEGSEEGTAPHCNVCDGIGLSTHESGNRDHLRLTVVVSCVVHDNIGARVD